MMLNWIAFCCLFRLSIGLDESIKEINVESKVRLAESDGKM